MKKLVLFLYVFLFLSQYTSYSQNVGSITAGCDMGANNPII